MSTEPVFGCPACFQADAPAAWEALHGFQHLAKLVDESHFMVHILACPRCGQRCVEVFTETIDWVDGDDPQYWSVLPVTPTEAEQLHAAGANVVALIKTMGHDRRYLQRDYPKGGAPRIAWAGPPLWIGPHD